MTGRFEHVRSRVEIDERARAARLALERDAVALGNGPRRLRALQLAMVELWRLVAGSWPAPSVHPLPSRIDDDRRSDRAAARHETSS